MNLRDRFFPGERPELPAPKDPAVGDFSVTAEGGRVLQRWLKAHQLLTEIPTIGFNGNESNLTLGKQEMDGVVMRQLKAFMCCNPGELSYELKNYFIITEQGQNMTPVGGGGFMVSVDPATLRSPRPDR